MRKLFVTILAFWFFTINAVNAQVVSGVSATTSNSKEYTSTGSFLVPPGVTSVLIDACAPGAGGGSGTTGPFNPGGGGGGGSGQWVAGYPLTVAANATLTITIGSNGTGGAVSGGASGNNGTDGGNLTITGAVDTFPTLYGGSAGHGADGFYFGAGGDGGGPNGMGGVGDNSILGNHSTLARPAFVFPYGGGGAGGGRGGGIDPFGGQAVLATYGLPNGPFFSLGAGTGSQAGGGGAPSPYGNGGLGGNSGTPTNGGAPTIGYCGGGGGSGASTSTIGGAGGGAFARVRW